MKRRDLFVSAGSALVASTSTQMMVEAAQPDHGALIAVLEQLEAPQGWESSGVACAKAFAAYRVRQALGLPLPDPERAQAHIDHHRQEFASHKRTLWYDREIAEGRAPIISPMEREL